jgi:uncharacterized glyoxalase superfamily protein PhnB
MTTNEFQFTGVTPYLFYEDANTMLDWLAKTLGFVERSRFVDANGVVQQAEMFIGDQQLWFSGHGPGYWSARGHRPHQLTLIWVDDVDAHHAHAVAAGATAEPPQNQTWGVRNYQLTDPEGYMWGFMTSLDTGYVQVLSPEEGGLTEVRE